MLEWPPIFLFALVKNKKTSRGRGEGVAYRFCLPKIDHNVLRSQNLPLHAFFGSNGILFNDKIDKGTEAIMEDPHALERTELLKLLLHLLFRHIAANVAHPKYAARVLLINLFSIGSLAPRCFSFVCLSNCEYVMQCGHRRLICDLSFNAAVNGFVCVNGCGAA